MDGTGTGHSATPCAPRPWSSLVDIDAAYGQGY